MSEYTLKVKNHLESLTEVGKKTRQFCNEFADLEKSAMIELSLVEAVANIIKHAQADLEESEIRLVYGVDGDCICIDITYQGIPMDPALYSRKTKFQYQSEDIQNLPENGFGVDIISSCMKSVDYHFENGVNHLRLISSLGTP